MNKIIIFTACILGMLSVILGAFAAHGLEKIINAESVETFRTGVQYQMYHALFLLVLGMIDNVSLKTKKIVFGLVSIGLVFFSGSIYGLSTNDLTSFDFKSIGFITPIGGLLLITAWGFLGIGVLKK